jgi:hypothetical protein
VNPPGRALPQVTDSTDLASVGPLRESFLRHLAAENKSASTLLTYGKAVEQFAEYGIRSGMPANVALGDGYGLIVVDTLGKLAGIRQEKDAGSAAAAMVPLQDAAHDGLGVIECRHERKGGGEVGESARGSSAFGGDVDIILSLRRPEGNQRATLRELHSLSRYDETPDRVLIELTDEGYALLGDVDSVAIAEAIRIVSDHLAQQFELNQSGLTVDELTDLSELARSTVIRALRQMEREDRVAVSGRGVRGNPKKYTLKGGEIDSDQTHLSCGWNESNGIPARPGQRRSADRRAIAE